MPWREPAQRVVAGKVNPNNPSSLPTIRLAREHRTVLSVGVFPFVQNPLALPLLMLSFQRRTYNLYANTSKIMPLPDIFSPDRAILLGPKVLFTQSLGDYRYASLLKLCDISNLLFVVSIDGYVLFLHNALTEQSLVANDQNDISQLDNEISIIFAQWNKKRKRWNNKRARIFFYAICAQ